MNNNFLIGTYSDNGIYHLGFDGKKLSHISCQNQFSNCSYLCNYNDIIFGVVENSKTPIQTDGHLFSMTSNFKIRNSSSLLGKSPCYISINSNKTLLFIGNYLDGSIDIFSLTDDLSISKLVCHKQYTSHSHIHYIAIHNQLLFVSDLGDDKIFAYEILFNQTTGELHLNNVASYQFGSGSGPRHLVFDNNCIYVLTEMSCELYKLSFSIDKGFKLENKVSIIPPDNTKLSNDTGCAIKISGDKKYIYATLRGHNGICVFDTENNLKLLQYISCFGETPRDICFDKTENFLLCANQNSDNISIFSRNKKTGYLNFDNSYPINSPACIINYDI